MTVALRTHEDVELSKIVNERVAAAIATLEKDLTINAKVLLAENAERIVSLLPAALPLVDAEETHFAPAFDKISGRAWEALVLSLEDKALAKLLHALPITMQAYNPESPVNLRLAAELGSLAGPGWLKAWSRFGKLLGAMAE